MGHGTLGVYEATVKSWKKKMPDKTQRDRWWNQFFTIHDDPAVSEELIELWLIDLFAIEEAVGDAAD